MDVLTAGVVGFMLGVFMTLAAERAARRTGRRTVAPWRARCWSAYCPRCGTAGLGEGDAPVGSGRCGQCGGTMVIRQSEMQP